MAEDMEMNPQEGTTWSALSVTPVETGRDLPPFTLEQLV